jgi:predicted DNA-binding antitoxin AbrB/MazE fold protein
MVNNEKISAVYSGGVLRPVKKLSLAEGEKVEIEIKERKGKKNISLRGLWKGSEVSEKDIDKAKHIWEKGVKEQIKFLEED